ncbi:hypothetical protein DPMN_023661 [Dreissena polymorpha]|uniref:Uncharacterized protein n=1 Tax=Dreissena polymorpha TaxID=45954 RepID=A0A9D4LND9_DREPO|nr:hypothetical protein DPMN_023661 [Dreissena polymorpha]
MKEQEDAGRVSTLSQGQVPRSLKKVIPLLNRVGDKNSRLIGNFTPNLCKSWMHIRTKFDGGKVVNNCNRFSWNTRCYGGGLRSNIGPKWVPIVWETCTKSKPGTIACNIMSARKDI